MLSYETRNCFRATATGRGVVSRAGKVSTSHRRVIANVNLMILIVLGSGVVLAQDMRAGLLQLEKRSGGTLGVFAMHVEKGTTISFNGNQVFPMASVYKLPIGIYFLNHVFEKKVRLSDSVTVTSQHLAPEHSPLLRRWSRDGDFVVTWDELLRLMVSESDNTACDMILDKVGGPGRVTRYFSLMGLNGFSIDRTEKQMALDQIYAGAPALKKYTGIAADSVFRSMPVDQLRRIAEKSLSSRKDVATPDGLGQLLLRLHRRSFPGLANYALIFKLLTETVSGSGRIKAGIPHDAILAHKTGTHRTFAGVNIASNDVGIVRGRNGDNIILVVMLKGSRLDSGDTDAIIAEVARLITAAWMSPN